MPQRSPFPYRPNVFRRVIYCSRCQSRPSDEIGSAWGSGSSASSFVGRPAPAGLRFGLTSPPILQEAPLYVLPYTNPHGAISYLNHPYRLVSTKPHGGTSFPGLWTTNLYGRISRQWTLHYQSARRHYTSGNIPIPKAAIYQSTRRQYTNHYGGIILKRVKMDGA